MNNPDEAVESVLDDVVKTEQRDRRALNILLDRQRQKQGYVLAFKVKMGSTVSYITSVTLEWVAQKVRYAQGLPIFKGKVDKETGKIQIDEDTASEIRQREPDWRRQFPMTMYLAKRPHRKFPPILVVAHQEWVHTPNADQWGADERAMQNSIDEQVLDSENVCAEIGTGENTTFYALDGQHRLMAIQGLHALLKEGKLYARNNKNKPTSKFESTEDWAELGIDIQQLQSSMAEQIGIEIIPAVLKGETSKEALQRLRSIFVHVNQNARRLAKSELALLDEDEGFVIVARRVASKHPLLKGHVHMKSGQLPKTSPYYTSMETVVAIAEEYLGQSEYYRSWKGDKELKIRPSDEELDSGTDKLSGYFDALGELPSHRAVINGAKDEEIVRMRQKDGEDNMLFRPLAQIALAKAVGFLERERECDVTTIVPVLAKQEKAGQLKLCNRKAPWFGVLTDPSNDEVMHRKDKNKNLCAKLLVHLLSGTPKEEQTALLAEFVLARVISRDGNEESWKAVDQHGNTVYQNKVELPVPWK